MTEHEKRQLLVDAYGEWEVEKRIGERWTIALLYDHAIEEGMIEECPPPSLPSTITAVLQFNSPIRNPATAQIARQRNAVGS